MSEKCDTFRTFWSGNRPFASENEIRKCIHADHRFSDDNLADAHLLKIFDTSKQHTWLVVSSEHLYCVLDDVRKDNPRVQWAISKAELRDENGNIQMSTSPVSKYRNIGLLHIAHHRNWLFSKKLFPNSSLESAVKKLIENM